MIDRFSIPEMGLLVLTNLLVLWAIGRYAMRTGFLRRVGRITRRYWQATLIIAFSFGVLLIIVSFQVSDRIATAVIAVLPPSIYYLYSEHLDQPAVSIDLESVEWSVAPMGCPNDILQEINNKVLIINKEKMDFSLVEKDDVAHIGPTESSPTEFLELNTTDIKAVRPAVFLNYDVRNEGKATAERATVQLKLLSNDNSTNHVARWTDPANSVEYDLRPGQRESVHIFKTFLTSTFFPTSPIISTDNQSSDITFEQTPIRPNYPFSGNPAGELAIFGKYNEEEFLPVTYVPRKKRPERSERSIGGGWEGSEVLSAGSESKVYTLEARLIADNYRTEWETIIDIKIPDKFVQIALDEGQWQDQWEGELEWIKERTIEYAGNYLNDS